MKLLSVGGGSGGHVTPVLAVINQLAQLDSELSVMFVTDAAFFEQSKGLMKHAVVPVDIRTITAGKLRRYTDISLWRQITHWPTMSKNVADMGRVGVGVVQSIRLLYRYRPDVVFAKGGYVSLPMGYAAHLLHIPLVLHDSDARPGLTNRILARWATHIATGMPLGRQPVYTHVPLSYIGVPIDSAYHPFSDTERHNAKLALGFSEPSQPLVVVTGGGLGARDINNAMIHIAPELLRRDINVYHVTGVAHEETVKAHVPRDERYRVVPFVYDTMPQLLGAADVVVSRGSATFLQEIAALHKPLIVIPSSSLGDQRKNAAVIEADRAGLVLSDETITNTPTALLDAILAILSDAELRSSLAGAIALRAMPHAARDMANIIVRAKRT